jgi:hypothetical protein
MMVSGPAQAKDAEGWKISGGSGSSITSGTGYDLYNIDQKLFLDYKDRSGANLGWQGTSQRNVEIKRKDGDGALKCGDLFAFKVDGEWIKHGKQWSGINLTSKKAFSDDLYQWKITKCQAGTEVRKDQPISLTNTKANDAVVGCKRPAGVNLAWASDVQTKMGVCVRTARSL